MSADLRLALQITEERVRRYAELYDDVREALWEAQKARDAWKLRAEGAEYNEGLVRAEEEGATREANALRIQLAERTAERNGFMARLADANDASNRWQRLAERDAAQLATQARQLEALREVAREALSTLRGFQGASMPGGYAYASHDSCRLIADRVDAALATTPAARPCAKCQAKDAALREILTHESFIAPHGALGQRRLVQLRDCASKALSSPEPEGTNEKAWLIERTIDGRPLWLAWRDREAPVWTDNAADADRYEWAVAAQQAARQTSKALGVECVATEHIFIPGSPSPALEGQGEGARGLIEEVEGKIQAALRFMYGPTFGEPIGPNELQGVKLALEQALSLIATPPAPSREREKARERVTEARRKITDAREIQQRYFDGMRPVDRLFSKGEVARVTIEFLDAALAALDPASGGAK